MEHKLIDISVNYFHPGGYWIVSALAHANSPPGDESPTEFGEAVDRDTRESGIEYATYWAGKLIGSAECEQVTIFVDGNEHRTYTS